MRRMLALLPLVITSCSGGSADVSDTSASTTVPRTTSTSTTASPTTTSLAAPSTTTTLPVTTTTIDPSRHQERFGPGAVGFMVTQVQWLLTVAGDPVSVDWVYGPELIAAVRRFEERAGLPATDGVSEAFLDALAADAGRDLLTAGGEAIAFGEGAAGAAVTAFERDLAAAGYEPGPVDGVFDGSTAAAVERLRADRSFEASPCATPDVLDAVAEEDAITGTFVDGRNGRPIGGQFEPGASALGVYVVLESGFVVGAGGNRCDGSYALPTVPEERFALLAVNHESTVPYWAPGWAKGGPAAIDPQALSAAFDLNGDGVADWILGDAAPLTAEQLAGAYWLEPPGIGGMEIDITVAPGMAEPDPGYAWFDPLPPPPELDPAEAWTDPAWWPGRSLEPSDEWPEADQVFRSASTRLVVDGSAVGLMTSRIATTGEPALRVAIATPTDGDPCWDGNLGYAVMVLFRPDGTVVDAVVVDLGATGFLCPAAVGEGETPRDLIVLGHRRLACDLPSGQVVQAWRPGPEGFTEVPVERAWTYLYPY